MTTAHQHYLRRIWNAYATGTAVERLLDRFGEDDLHYAIARYASKRELLALASNLVIERSASA